MNPFDDLMGYAHDSHAQRATKQIDKANSHHGPVRQAPQLRADISAPETIMVCSECAKPATSEALPLVKDGEVIRRDTIWTPRCKCMAALTAQSVRGTLHLAGSVTASETKPSRLCIDMDAAQLWLERGAKPHPFFARKAWLAARSDANHVIRPIPQVAARPTERHQMDCQCVACMEFKVWRARKRTTHDAPTLPLKAAGDGFVWLAK